MFKYIISYLNKNDSASTMNSVAPKIHWTRLYLIIIFISYSHFILIISSISHPILSNLTPSSSCITSSSSPNLIFISSLFPQNSHSILITLPSNPHYILFSISSHHLLDVSIIHHISEVNECLLIYCNKISTISIT